MTKKEKENSMAVQRSILFCDREVGGGYLIRCSAVKRLSVQAPLGRRDVAGKMGRRGWDHAAFAAV